jgi:hypothetical protein
MGLVEATSPYRQTLLANPKIPITTNLAKITDICIRDVQNINVTKSRFFIGRD